MSAMEGSGAIGRRDSISLLGLQQIQESKDPHESMVESGTDFVAQFILSLDRFVSFYFSDFDFGFSSHF
jgi:hypothetical protein